MVASLPAWLILIRNVSLTFQGCCKRLARAGTVRQNVYIQNHS